MNIGENIYSALNLTKHEVEEEKKTEEIIIGEKADILRTATKEKPVFLYVMNTNSFPDTLCACTGVRKQTIEINKHYTETSDVAELRVLEGDFRGQGRIRKLEEIAVKVIPTTDKLMDIYKSVLDSIEIVIEAYRYPEINVPDDMYHMDVYKIKIPHEKESVYYPKNVHTLDETIQWMLKNHPEEYIGMYVESNVGDMMLSAIPQAYDNSGKNLWATYKGREQLIREIAAAQNYEVGEFHW